MTDTYKRRMAMGTPWERDVADALWLRGWTVEPVGQGQLSAPTREALRDYQPKAGGPTLLRWFPDICAWKRVNGRVWLYLIDAKAGDTWRQTDNHDVELSALRAAEAIEQAWGIPPVFVFQDWSVAKAKTIRDHAHAELDGVAPGRTRFVIFPRSACTPFDAAFGSPDIGEQVA
jgi:hypothetical protein